MKEIISGNIIRDETGKAKFVPDPQGKWNMIIERQWALGIDPYRVQNWFKRLITKIKNLLPNTDNTD